MDQYFEGLTNIAITVCDADGNILDMNQHSADVNSKGQKIIGYNLMNCHPEPAKTKLKGLLEHQQLNAYTIEKTVVVDTRPRPSQATATPSNLEGEQGGEPKQPGSSPKLGEGDHPQDGGGVCKVKKLIYQTPWYKEDGTFGGLIEYSIEIPFEMPHFVRQPKQ